MSRDKMIYFALGIFVVLMTVYNLYSRKYDLVILGIMIAVADFAIAFDEV